MAPVILLTPSDGLTPMMIGSPSGEVQLQWNRTLLIVLWTFQSLLLLLQIFTCFLFVMGTLVGGNGLVTMYVLPLIAASIYFNGGCEGGNLKQ